MPKNLFPDCPLEGALAFYDTMSVRLEDQRAVLRTLFPGQIPIAELPFWLKLSYR